MTREQALDAATALYPAEMAGLDHPWLHRILWGGRNASSPDTAAKTLADEGRIQDGYVDTLWDAIRADVETVQRAKARRLDQAYREIATALESGKRAIAERLAAIRAETAERTATGRLSAVGAKPTPIDSSKYSIREARQAIRDQNAAHPEGYTNRQTGNVAFINSTQVREMTTETSIAKTMRHGFSTYEHLHAVAVAPTLYENATLVRDDPDTKHGDATVRILRYAAPIAIDREGAPIEATAWLTVKTSERHGHRVYSLELLELTEARRIAEDTTSTALPRTRNLDDTIPYPGADVNPRRAVRGGYRDGLWSERANDALLRGLRTEAQIAQALGIPYGAWMTHRPLGPRGESKILGVLDENGRDLYSYDLLDLQTEWHHVGRHFDEVLFLDPDDFPDVRTPADITDKHTAALFFHYTRMRQAPREPNADKLTKGERNDTLLPAEQAIARHFEATVAPARDAFVRAIAANADTETLRALAAPYAEAMRQHKRMADATTKAALAAIGKPRAYRNERPRSIAGLRYAVGGWLEGRRWAREAREDDARFAQAHAEGDRATAEALVLKHARHAGYLHEAWRGTDDFGRVNLGLRRYGAPNHAIFLAGTPEMAGTYADNPEVREVGRGNQKGSGIYHVAIRFVNPLIVDAQGATWDTIPADAEGHVVSTRGLSYQAIREGRDGVIIHNLQDHNPLNDHGAPRTPATVYIVTAHPQNIKSLDPFTYDGDGNLITLSRRFDPRTPDIRRSVGGAEPAATPARQKDAHGAYPDLGEEIATTRFSVGAKRKQEYRALIAKARPNLPQEDVDAFMAELDTLGDTKKEKAALHWFIKGSIILPEDRDKLDMAVAMSGKHHLDFQAFDSPAALINEANARAEAKKKKPAIAYLDPDTVPQLTNKRDLGHGVVIYDVEDSPAGQQAMRQIMNSHLGRNADGEFWSPWCLLTCSPTTGALSESARKYWARYGKTGRAAAFHNGRLCAFQSSDTRERQWWDLNDKSHGEWVPYIQPVTAHDLGWTDVPGHAIVQQPYEVSQSTKHNRTTLDIPTSAIVGDKQNGEWQKWVLGPTSYYLQERATYKNGKLDGVRVQYRQTPRDRDTGLSRVYLMMFEEFADGVPIRQNVQKDQNGTVTHRSKFDGGRGTGTYYDWQGSLTGTLRDFDDGTAERQNLSPDGTPLRVWTFPVESTGHDNDIIEDYEYARLDRPNFPDHARRAYVSLNYGFKGRKDVVISNGTMSEINGSEIASIQDLKAFCREHDVPLTQRVLDRLDAFMRGDLKAMRVKDPFEGVPLPDLSAYEPPAPRRSIIGAVGASNLHNAGYRLTEDARGRRILTKAPNATRTLLQGLNEAAEEVRNLVGTDFTRGERARATRLTHYSPTDRDNVALAGRWRSHQADRNNPTDAYVLASKHWGWSLGKDGKWRLEIPYGTLRKGARARLGNKAKENRDKERDAIPLGELINDEPLFAAYPGLANTPIYALKSPRGNTTQGYAGLGMIAIYPTKHKNNKALTDTLYHEIQHIIQEKENFEHGASDTTDWTAYANAIGEAEARVAGLHATQPQRVGLDLFFTTPSQMTEGNIKGKDGQWRRQTYDDLTFSHQRLAASQSDYLRDVRLFTKIANAKTLPALMRLVKTRLNIVNSEFFQQTEGDTFFSAYIEYRGGDTFIDTFADEASALRTLKRVFIHRIARQPRRAVGGSAPFDRADFIARATPIANDPNVKERSAHYVPIGDVPDALVRLGATPGDLLTTDGKIAKIARRHDLPPERLADAIEAMTTPVAVFLEWADAERGTIGLSVLTDTLADDGEGRQAPVRLMLITRTDAPGMFLTSAYARKRNKEHNYVERIAEGGLLYVDEQRVAQLPLEDATVSACVPSNVRGDPLTNTIPYPGAEVKPQNRSAVGGADERLRAVNARVRTAALYYGRSPAEADIAQRAIVEVALFAEASRTGKTLKTDDVRRAYADFGIETDDRHAATIADRINEQARQERYTPRKKGNASTTPRDIILQQQERLRQAYDIHWTQAQKDAFAQGVAGAFGASRDLARDAMEVAKTKRDEAEAIAQAATNSSPCSPTTAPSPSTKTRPKPSSASPSTTATPESSTMRLRGWDERRSGGLGGETLRGLTRNP